MHDFFFSVSLCLLYIFVIISPGFQPRDWLWRASPKWPILCWVECKTTTQLIKQCLETDDHADGSHRYLVDILSAVILIWWAENKCQMLLLWYVVASSSHRQHWMKNPARISGLGKARCVANSLMSELLFSLSKLYSVYKRLTCNIMYGIMSLACFASLHYTLCTYWLVVAEREARGTFAPGGIMPGVVSQSAFQKLTR